MSTLHTVNKFRLSSPALMSCLAVALPGDAILLMEDGVYNAGTLDAGDIPVYVLQEDLRARGVSEDTLPADATIIGYADFVSLVCSHDKTVSWF